MSSFSSLLSLMEDEVSIAPPGALTAAQVRTYGAAVTYRALIERGMRKVIGNDGREVQSTVQVTIRGRVHVDPRSQLTLPAGFSPRTPPILNVTMAKALGLDHTVIAV